MRFLFNLLGGVVLALAVIFAVADIAASLADDTLRLTTLGQAATALGIAPDVAATQSPRMVDLLPILLGWPASIVTGVLAFLFLFLGRPPRRRRGSAAL